MSHLFPAAGLISQGTTGNALSYRAASSDTALPYVTKSRFFGGVGLGVFSYRKPFIKSLVKNQLRCLLVLES